MLERHRRLFGRFPKSLTADKGYWESTQTKRELEARFRWWRSGRRATETKRKMNKNTRGSFGWHRGSERGLKKRDSNNTPDGFHEPSRRRVRPVPSAKRSNRPETAPNAVKTAKLAKARLT